MLVSIDAMTPEEYSNGGIQLQINYGFSSCAFGKIILASTPKGICHVAFYEDEEIALATLKKSFPRAGFHKQSDVLQEAALAVFQNDSKNVSKIILHIKGTGFQLKVWDALLKIPFGSLSTYGNIAAQIGQPNASRAVGTSIGSNPVAVLIPCHRVVQASGKLGGYMWGESRKRAIIGWEGEKLALANMR